MDINIKGGGLTRTVKCDCPDPGELFPLMNCGDKLSYAEIKNLQIKFNNYMGGYKDESGQQILADTGLSLESFNNTTDQSYVVFYNIPLTNISVSSTTSVPICGAFVILPHQKLDTQVTLFTSYPPNIAGSGGSGVWELHEDDTDGYLTVYPINQM